MGLMSLAVGSGVEINIIADGEDEEKAITVLSEFIQKEQ
jgi:catabolite repression HPr-like protein